MKYSVVDGRYADDRQPSDTFGSDIVVVSNRQPYSHEYDDGEVTVSRPVGGLTAGLDPVLRRHGGTWVAWGDGEADDAVTDSEDCVQVPPEAGDDDGYTLRRVWLSDADVEEYYLGYSNQVLWPLCHSDTGRMTPRPEFWHRYRAVNERFAEATASVAVPGGVVWLNDYHLALAPRTLRRTLTDETRIGQFWHIPWPSWDVFRACPQARELLAGLLGTDLLGFHVDRYCANFLECVDACFPDATVDWATGEVVRDGHTTAVRSFPMGVDADAIAEASSNVDEPTWRTLCERHGIDPDIRLAVGVDRLDYTKGIPQRIDALERLWEDHPEWRENLTYVQKASKSRTGIPAYQRVIAEVDEAIERVNGRFGTDDWTPIVRIDETLSIPDLYGLYRHSDIALVSPVRDGMNLVAKEYVAAQVDGDGVLLLSNLAGAHEELGDDAVTISPYDVEGFVDGIAEALSMSTPERRARMRRLRRSVEDDDLHRWSAEFVGTLRESKAARKV